MCRLNFPLAVAMDTLYASTHTYKISNFNCPFQQRILSPDALVQSVIATHLGSMILGGEKKVLLFALLPTIILSHLFFLTPLVKALFASLAILLNQKKFKQMKPISRPNTTGIKKLGSLSLTVKHMLKALYEA